MANTVANHPINYSHSWSLSIRLGKTSFPSGLGSFSDSQETHKPSACSACTQGALPANQVNEYLLAPET